MDQLYFWQDNRLLVLVLALLVSVGDFALLVGFEEQHLGDAFVGVDASGQGRGIGDFECDETLPFRLEGSHINDYAAIADKNAGLKGLGGAKVEVVFADNQGSPATGQNQALRLITEEKVVALTGAYQSGITLTASATARRSRCPQDSRRRCARGCRAWTRASPSGRRFLPA